MYRMSQQKKPDMPATFGLCLIKDIRQNIYGSQLSVFLQKTSWVFFFKLHIRLKEIGLKRWVFAFLGDPNFLPRKEVEFEYFWGGEREKWRLLRCVRSWENCPSFFSLLDQRRHANKKGSLFWGWGGVEGGGVELGRCKMGEASSIVQHQATTAHFPEKKSVFFSLSVMQIGSGIKELRNMELTTSNSGSSGPAAASTRHTIYYKVPTFVSESCNLSRF